MAYQVPGKRLPDYAHGEIYWGTVEAAEAVGHEQRNKRPHLIVSDGRLPRRSKLVLACPLTTSEPPKDSFLGPLWVRVEPDQVTTDGRDPGLDESGYIITYQVRVMSVDRFDGRIGRLKPALRTKVEAKLILALNIEN